MGFFVKTVTKFPISLLNICIVSLMLSACGGGGSEGYYEDNDKGSTQKPSGDSNQGSVDDETAPPGTDAPLTPSEPDTPVTPGTSIPSTPIGPSTPIKPDTSIPATPIGPSTPIKPDTSIPATPIGPSTPIKPDTSIPATPIDPNTPITGKPWTPIGPSTAIKYLHCVTYALCMWRRW